MSTIEPMWRLPDVKIATGMSKRTIYRWVAKGLLPPPVRIGPNAVGWPESAITAWQRSLLESSQAP